MLTVLSKVIIIYQVLYHSVNVVIFRSGNFREIGYLKVLHVGNFRELADSDLLWPLYE